jgi:hypothetical protein
MAPAADANPQVNPPATVMAPAMDTTFIRPRQIRFVGNGT